MSAGVSEPVWPRGAVEFTDPNEYRRFTLSFADFSRQARSWAFFRKFGIGFASACYVFGQGAVSATELLALSPAS